MKKKKLTVLLTSYISAAFLILGGFLYQSYQNNILYQRYIEHNYQHAFAELVNSVGEIDSALQKSVYATSPKMISAVCTQVYGKAMSAEMAMSELPFSNYELETTASFIAKIGDYAYALSRNASNGEGYTDEEYDNLVSLSESANLLSDNLIQLYADMQSGGITISELSNAGAATKQTGDTAIPSNLGENFKLIEQEFPEIPHLIYDGPFSEHISGMKSEMLKNGKEITEAGALDIASEFTGIKKSTLNVSGSREGDMAVYIVEGSDNGGDVTVEVTTVGGFVAYYSNNRDVEESTMGTENAVATAKQFLSEHGYENMKTTYWTIHSGVLTVNFAYSQDDVICYNDLIKVSVALDNGRIVGFEAKGYITSHKEREIPEINVSKEDAQSAVNSDLKILSHGMSVIPTMGKNEVYCHEFKCQNQDGKHYIVYVNTDTGKQENILILLEDESGTLTL